MEWDNEIELKHDRKLSLLIFVLGSFFFGYFLFDTFSSKHYKLNFGFWLLAILFGTIFLMGIYFVLNKSIQVRINNVGIFWYDKLFSRNKEIQLFWEDIQSCYLADKTSRGVQDLQLIFTSKSNEEFKLVLSGYDKPWKEIYQTVENYSKKYKFGFLGLESLE